MLPIEETHELFSRGHGTTPDLIYAMMVPDSPSPDPNTFDKKKCTLIPLETSLCRNFVFDNNIAKKSEKYSPLIATLKK